MKSVVLFAIALLLLSFSCNTTDPPPLPERVKLTLIDVAVKEAYLHIVITNPASDETLALQRNGATAMTFAAVADTTVADTALTQSTAYQYTAIVQTNTTTGTSNTIFTQTLAPTSHSFTWETVLLGDGNGSALYDVALINDTLAYAVGEVYLSGDPMAYNLVRWNGQNWHLLRIQFLDFCGQPSTYPYPARAVFAFGANDVWITSGSQLVRWNGTAQTTPVCIPVSVNRLWGNSASSVYAVGAIGKIAHFNGTTWIPLESGTTTSILDAWGIVNPMNSATEVYCAAGNKLLRVRNGTRIDSVRWVGNRTLDGIWTHQGFPIFTAGDGVFENSSGEYREVNIGASIYTNAIRGSSLNNIIAVGGVGLLAHFNGLSWNPFFENPGGDYYNVAVGENLVIAVGEMNTRGLIIIGRR